MCSPDCLLVILAIIFPPLPVWVKSGLCSADSVINIALCVLGFVPGLIHSWYIIATRPDESEAAEGGYYQRVAIVDEEQGRQQPTDVQTGQPGPRQPGGIQQNYGTVGNDAMGGIAGGQPHGNGVGNSSSSSAPPPPYTEVVPADNKIQRT